jgi:hypothetical protein
MLFFRWAIVLVVVCFSCAGCNLRSRWALDDPVYSKKYAEARQSPLRKVKQAIDARHVEGGAGVYVAGGSSFGSLTTTSGSLGGFKFPTEWQEVYGGLTSVHGTVDGDSFGGVELGIRVQSPSRVAPFVGIGGVAAPPWGEIALWTINALLNDDDCTLCEQKHDAEDVDGFAAFFPEIGAHVWINHKIRLSAFARYYFADEGDEFSFAGVSLSFFGGGDMLPEFEFHANENPIWDDEVRLIEQELEAPLYGREPRSDLPPSPPHNPYEHLQNLRRLPPVSPEAQP